MIENTSILSAGAVDATMFGAGAADESELLFEGMACAMDTDGRVAGGDSSLLCEDVEGGVSEINVAEDFAVGRLHGVERFNNALADDIVSLRVWCGFGRKVLRPAFEGTVLSGAVAIVIDDGVAQDAVEPGAGGLFFT